MKVVKIPTWNNLWTKVRGGWAPSKRSERVHRKGCRYVLLPNGRKLRLIPLWRIGIKRYSSTDIIFSPQVRSYLRSNVWDKESDRIWAAADLQVTAELEILLERVRKVVG